MINSSPGITSTTHILPFDQLSPADFERLCLWLVELEGYRRAEHLGLAGSEQGRDIVAYKPTVEGEELWYFQCKRRRSIKSAMLKAVADGYSRLAQANPGLQPIGVVFVVTCAISARVREDVAAHCADQALKSEFWALTELDMRVKGHPDLLQEFFGLRSELTLSSEEKARLERHYLGRVAATCGKLKTEGIDDPRVALTDVYVVLDALESPRPTPRVDIAPLTQRLQEMEVEQRPDASLGHKEVKPEHQATKPPAAPVPLFEALRQHLRLVILGEPGTGKTTTLQFLALRFAKEGLAEEQPRLEKTWVPVQLDLRKHTGKRRLEEMLAEEVADLAGFDPLSSEETLAKAALLIRSWWKDEKLAILLDGLDELTEARRASMIASIQHFSNPMGRQRCRFVVTSRIAGYRQAPQLDEFAHFTLCPLGRSEDLLSYVTGWLQALRSVELRAIGVVFEGTAGSEAERLIRQMTERPGLRRVMSNPLLLRLAIAVYRDTGELASNSAQLYLRYVENVLYKRAEASVKSGWSFPQVDEALQSAAWALQTQRDQTVDMLRAALDDNDAAELLDYLRNRLGLLVVYRCEKGERVAFSHSTFREYLVAVRLAQAWSVDFKGTWRFLRPRLHHPAWRESVLLTVTMIEAKGAYEVVKRILRAKSPCEKELHRDLLLTADCLASGVQLAPRLTRTILEKLLSLYLRETRAEITPVSQRLFIRTIELTFGSLQDEDRTYILDSLLALAVGKERVKQATAFELAARPAIAVRRFLLILWMFLRVLTQTKEASSIREITGFPAFLREARVGIVTDRRLTAIRALGNLGFRSPETVSMLLKALEDLSLRGVAAEALGRLAPGTTEVATALLDAQWHHRQAHDWDSSVETILEALGVLGQRHASVVEFLLQVAEDTEADPWGMRFAATYALCRSAETDPHAMAFVLRGWRNLYAKEITQDGATDLLDACVREGLKDGSKLRQSASPAVIRYLLEVLCDSDDSELARHAGNILAGLAAGSPLVSCRTMGKDGSCEHKTLDLTEKMFNLMLQQLPQKRFSNVAQYLLIQWGLSRTEVLSRLIKAVRDSDAWLIAWIVETEWLGPKGILGSDPPSETVAFLRQSIARLRSSIESVQDAELNFWRAAIQSSNKDDWQLKYLPKIIASIKYEALHSAYELAYAGVWEAQERKWGEPAYQLPDPYAMAALACFRGWSSGFTHLGLSAQELEEEFHAQVNRALEILEKQSDQAVMMLSGVISGTAVRLASGDLESMLVEEDLWMREVRKGKTTLLDLWRTQARPSFQERIAAAYSLTQLTRRYPEAQTILISNLKPSFWQRGEISSLETEVQEHLVRALGYVTRASHDLAATLVEIATDHDGDVYGAGSSALGHLRDPSTEAVPLLIQAYEQLADWRRVRPLEALGTLEMPTPEVVDLLVGALKAGDEQVRSTAAKGLGNLREPDKRVINALARSIRNTIAAVDALGKHADHFTAVYGSKGQARLRKVSGSLQRSLRRDLPSWDHTLGRSGEDVVREALSRVVARLTEMEVKTLQDSPALSAPTPVRTGPLSVFLIAFGVVAAAISGLASNIIAAFLQDQLGLVNDAWRISIVVAVFVLTLAVAIWLALRQQSAVQKRH